MAMKINIQSTVIPVEIGDLKFEIDVTDENYERLTQIFNTFLLEMENLNDAESEDLDLLKEREKVVYDALLGEGAFEKIYSLSPSIAVMTGILTQLVEYLEEEMMKRLDPKTTKKSPSKKKINDKKVD